MARGHGISSAQKGRETLADAIEKAVPFEIPCDKYTRTTEAMRRLRHLCKLYNKGWKEGIAVLSCRWAELQKVAEVPEVRRYLSERDNFFKEAERLGLMQPFHYQSASTQERKWVEKDGNTPKSLTTQSWFKQEVEWTKKH
ncbi:hypothetical protein N7532_011200 [Penicillium argentinense]|uniref:Uncharacterized protein n=1 Tax=Penicillium argentinense TaxID=1131581 RepID=A0A9W9JV09_9EURO|nr:uncharacterized protein N7532_011200 [Penicillium argentinense]KAJ5082157.1 hypothetical protein N7532_011200 [Penicillium argentinense]